MNVADILHAWGRIITGRAPSLSIEVTRECPLRCPGCYAYDDNHLGGGITLRQLRDFKGDELVNGVVSLVRKHKPLHVSLVGGDPLVRYREMEQIVPQLLGMGIHVQVVTSAFRPICSDWADLKNLNVVVSIDGLAEDHDVRRAPATYERILRNIQGQNITVHCTITGQIMKKPGYLDEFSAFWSQVPDVKRIWFSIFTPQRGAQLPEILTREERLQAIEQLVAQRRKFPKLDLPEAAIREFAHPPASPDECIFAQTTATYSADLTSAITPCQFGGDPDCSQCGCIASVALAAVGRHRLGGVLPVKHIFNASLRAGRLVSPPPERPQPSPFPIVQ